MANLWSLPCIYICENNHYAMGTSTQRSTKFSNYHARDPSIPGIRCDGQDIFSVIKTMEYAKTHALNHGPIFLNIETYRYHGHSMSDPGISYRTREEVQEVRQTRDPLVIIQNYLKKFDFFDAKEIKSIEKSVKQEVDKACVDAENDPLPDLQTLSEDTYIDPQNHYVRGVEMRDRKSVV